KSVFTRDIMNVTTTTTENYGGHSGLTRRAALLMAANVIATVMSFALPLVLVRTMSQAEYGLYKQAFQITFSALCLLNLQVAVSVFYFYGLVGALVGFAILCGLVSTNLDGVP